MKCSLSFPSLFLIILGVLFVESGFSQGFQCPAPQHPRVIFIGDSWLQIPYLVWQSHRKALDKYGHHDKLLVGDLTTRSGLSAKGLWENEELDTMVSQLQSHPSVDIAILSVGGNDFMKGDRAAHGYHADLPMSQAIANMEVIMSWIDSIIQTIKIAKPGIEILISSYDFPNFEETLIIPGLNPYEDVFHDMHEPTPLEMNTGLNIFENRRAAYAAADSSVHHANATGLMQYIYGYPSPLPFFNYPPTPFPPMSVPFPGGDPNYPSPPVGMQLGGFDAFHLSEDGFNALAENYMKVWLFEKLRNYPDLTFYSQGGLNDGWVRTDSSSATGEIIIGDSDLGDFFQGILSFNTSSLPPHAVIIRSNAIENIVIFIIVILIVS